MAELKKELGLTGVFAVASGAMISSGLFVLPAIAYMKAGPALILSYLLASVLMVPSVLSQAELSSAMPKAGGMYFYVERSLGPILGLFTGLADWFSLALKSAFAVLGVAIFCDYLLGEFLNVNMNTVLLKSIAIFCCAFFTFLNIISVKHTSRFQVILVFVLLSILALFILAGASSLELTRFKNFFAKGPRSIIATAGLVFISFGGLNKVVNIAEEVREPGRNLPLGVLIAWLVVTLFYLGVAIITVGVVDGHEIEGNLMPLSLAASKFLSIPGLLLLGVAALAAFITTANAGILASSRCPLAMSRDQLLPRTFSRVNKRFKTPHTSILITSGFMVVAVVFLDVEMLAKTASTLLIILYIFANVSVIVMRESRIQSYRPKFKIPLYPYLPVAAIIIYTVLIIDMGAIPLLICFVFISLSTVWYFFYASDRASRASAIMHIVERVTDRELKTVTLENELRDILIERDDIVEDRFDKLIKQCEVIDIEGKYSAEDVFRRLSSILAEKLDVNEYVLFEKFLYREEQGSTIVQPGLAIPHIIVDGQKKFDIVVVRAVDGIDFPHADIPIKIMFVLAGSKDERNYHLRALMAIAQIAQEKDFEKQWLTARDTASIRNLILLSKRQRDIKP